MNIQKRKSSLWFVLITIICIITGNFIGEYASYDTIRYFATFSYLYKSILLSLIPFIIIIFVIGSMIHFNAGGTYIAILTMLIAIISLMIISIYTVTLGYFTLPYIFSSNIFSNDELLKSNSLIIETFISFNFKKLQILSPINALIISIAIGILMSLLTPKNKIQSIRNLFDLLYIPASKFIANAILLMPIFAISISAETAYRDSIGIIESGIYKVFLFVLIINIKFMIFQYFIAHRVSGKSMYILLKNMSPSYITGLASGSSIITAPTTALCMQKNGVNKNIADFIAISGANFHMPGSIVTCTTGAISMIILSSMDFSYFYVLMYGITIPFCIFAAPSIPGSTVFIASSYAGSFFDFSADQISILILIHMLQGFIGACFNCGADGALGVVVDKIIYKIKK